VKLRMLHGLTAAAILALACFGAFAWSRRVDAENAVQYGEDLRSLLALHLRLTGEVLKSRSGIVGHYDGLVQSEAGLTRVHERLRVMPSFLPPHARAELSAQLARSESVLRESALLVERFKREHSVLRNSLRYLPVLARELRGARSEGAGTGGERLSHSLDALVRDELLLQSWHDHSILERVRRGVRELEDAARSVPALDTRGIERALNHARAVSERTPIVNDLVRRIVALPAVPRTRALMSTFSRHHQAALDAAEADAVALFALALIAVSLGAASIIARLRRSAATLRRTGAELERAISSLRVEQENQKELAKLKSRFVSMTSHEFRTPLSVIMSSSEMLDAYADKWPKEKKADHFERIRAAALGMTRMLDAILMIGKSDAGVLEFKPRVLEIGGLCNDVLEAVGHDTHQRRRIVYHGPDSGAEHVVADETLLRQILENLLSNALKYSAEARPVGLDVARHNGELLFTVSDQGIGIPVDDQKRLYETFHRGANVGSVSGTGLGLAIVKRAVDLHGGGLSLDSELGVGTRFTVRIPCTRSES
jgi:signal transduction histidine kinase